MDTTLSLWEDKTEITVEELATQILDKDFEKVNATINALAEKYLRSSHQIA